MTIYVNRDIAEFIKISQFGRRMGWWKVYLVFNGGHDVVIGKHHIRFVGPNHHQPTPSKATSKVWDLDRKMWYRPLWWSLGQWSLWERGTVRYKYGFGKPKNVMTGPNPI